MHHLHAIFQTLEANNKITRTKVHLFARIWRIYYICKYILFCLNKHDMNTKLTLTIEQSIIKKAKSYAKSKGRSLSGIIENYLKVITKEELKSNSEITPLVKSLRGSFTVPANFNYKKELIKGLSEKYL